MKRILGLSVSVLLALGMASLLIAFSAQAVDDTTPPNLLGLDFTPKVVDVSDDSQAVTFTIQLTDDLSGIDYASLYLGSPSGARGFGPIFFDPISGDTLSGTMQDVIWVPQFTENGNWLIEYAHAYDVAGNVHFWEQDELRTMGIPVTLTVTGAQSDHLPPHLLGLTFTPTVVDVSDGPQAITFTAQLTDDLSGISDASFYLLHSAMDYYILNLSDLVDGDVLSGTLQGVFEMPQYSPNGKWYITILYAFDQAGNPWQWYAYELEAMGIQTTLIVGLQHYVFLPVVIRR